MVVTATSATGTCHGPTIWSRAVMPGRHGAVADGDEEVLLATAGRRARADRVVQIVTFGGERGDGAV